MSVPRLSPSARRLAGLVLAAVAAQALLALLLAWPSAGIRMQGAPLVVAGPTVIAESAKSTFEAGSPGTWRITLLPDEAAARRAVLDRQAYGAVVIQESGLKVLFASAASPTVAQALAQTVAPIQAKAQGTTLTVEELAAAPKRDPRGTVLAMGLLAVTLSSVGFGLVTAARIRSARQRAVAPVLFAVGGGLGSAAVLHGVLGALTGGYLAEAGVLGLVALACAAAPVALAAVADLPGAVLAALVVGPVGYPVSGAASAPELVPAPWGQVGAYLPPGAGSAALRDVTFFHGAASGQPLAVLGCWAALAVLLIALPTVERWWRRSAERTPGAAATSSKPPVQEPVDA